MLDHLSIQCTNLAASVEFYDRVLEVLGGRRIFDREDAIGYGVDFPTFWLGPHRTGAGFRESHIAFRAPSSRCRRRVPRRGRRRRGGDSP